MLKGLSDNYYAFCSIMAAVVVIFMFGVFLA